MLYFCVMKRIFIIILLLILSGCGLFKKSVAKHSEKIELEQETKTETKSDVLEKSEQKTFVLQAENQTETIQIRADSVSYNPHSGDFRAKGNVSIVSSKKQAKQSKKQDFLTSDKESKNLVSTQEKTQTQQSKTTQSKEIEKRKTSFLFQLSSCLFLLVVGYLVYRKIKGKIV